MIEERDVVIVGGGIAGLVAAHRLREHDPVVLEASDRVGGRIWSKQRGDLALSVGAHMFPPPDSVVGRLATELGLEIRPIPGSMLNIHCGGRLVRDSRPELFPFRLALPLGARISFARAGLRVRRDANAYMRLLERRPGDTDADVRLRALAYRGDETFGDFLGKLHPDAFRIFEALANRSIADPDEISMSAMSALFGHVWDAGDLGRNMRGGSGLLPDALGRSLGSIVRVACRVQSIGLDGAGVRIRYTGPDGSGEIRARTAIAAIPAPHLPGILGDAMPPDTREALGSVSFGPMAVLSIHTDEREPMPWDDLYSILTPDLRFNMFFNHANFMHGSGPKQGSVIMIYGGGRRARPFLGGPEDAVRDAFLADLDRLYPQVRPHIAETWVKVWEHAGPFAAPGRWRAQAALDRGIADRIFFAGDWVSEFVSMETAALTAVDAAANVRRVLERSRDDGPELPLARDALQRRGPA
jgi:protoporphyrinogen/coproporphyrinogen III oxidase